MEASLAATRIYGPAGSSKECVMDPISIESLIELAVLLTSISNAPPNAMSFIVVERLPESRPATPLGVSR